MSLNAPIRKFFCLAQHQTSLLDATKASGYRSDWVQIKTPARDRSINMGLLFCILVLVTGLHLSGVKWFILTAEPEPDAKPLSMEVSLLAIPAPKPVQAPPSPPKPAAKKPPRKKIQPKPKLKKKADGAPSAFAATEQVLQQQPEKNDVAKVLANASPAPKAEIQPYTEAYIRPDYKYNPKPDYPRTARNRGWQGTVVLRVQVSAEGKPESVSVEHSCGHDLLDKSAAAAVKAWQFVPARRGETEVASTVLVPIVFALQEPASW
jgi:protein TonB